MTNNNTSGHDSSKTYTFPKGAALQKSSIISVLCRICYDGDKDEELIQPCNCKVDRLETFCSLFMAATSLFAEVTGTVAFVHKSCLETWLGESNTTACELCHTTFKTERTPRYNARESIWQWIRSNPSGLATAVRSDIVACAVITPLAIVITYVCLFSSEYYNQNKFSNVPAARWTSVSLLIMIGIMLIGYYMWVYSVVRMHARMWYNWWQRTCDVRYIAPVTIDTEVLTSVSRDISMPSENSNFSTDTNQATVIDMKELLKHVPPTHVQSRSHETNVIEMENIQNKRQSSIAGTENIQHFKSSDICNIQKIKNEVKVSSHICIGETQLSGLKDDQQPTCSTTPTIQNLNQHSLNEVDKTNDVDIETREQFTSTRAANIPACVSTGISANQQFSKYQLMDVVVLAKTGDKDHINTAGEFGSIGMSESLVSKELLSSVSQYGNIEGEENKQACSSTGNRKSRPEAVEPRESRATFDSQSQERSQHVIGDVSSQGSSSDTDNKK